MNRLIRDSVRIAVSFVLSLLLLVQGLSPAGYMPASLDSGWLVMLCPEGLPDKFFAALTDDATAARPQHSAGHHHATHSTHQGSAGSPSADTTAVHDSSSDYCPLGSAVGAPALAMLPEVITDPFPVPQYAQPAYATQHFAAPVLRTQPRAPPIA